jgi:hypothetical protein
MSLQSCFIGFQSWAVQLATEWIHTISFCRVDERYVLVDVEERIPNETRSHFLMPLLAWGYLHIHSLGQEDHCVSRNGWQ